MAEGKRWGKWEGPGEPEGKGGTSTPESPEQIEREVEGRGNKNWVFCYNCKAGASINDNWRWFTCWKCGSLNYHVQ